MKNIIQFIKESKERTFNTTLREWFEWYLGPSYFDGKITRKVCEMDGSLDYNCEELDMSYNEFANWLNDHMDDEITIIATDIGNTIDHVFTVDGKELGFDAICYFGDTEEN